MTPYFIGGIRNLSSSCLKAGTALIAYLSAVGAIFVSWIYHIDFHRERVQGTVERAGR